MKSPKVGFVSLGCPKALVDSERILTQLKTEGYDVASDYDGADLVVVNTCGFIESAVQESLDAIGEAMSANGRVIVTGCLGKDEDKIRQMHPNVLKVTGAAAYQDVMEAVHEYVPAPPKHNPFVDLVPEQGIRLTPKHYAYLKISEGCDRPCSFCAIPLMRGKHVSQPIEKLVKEAEGLARDGVKELILIAQDLTYYGLDIYKKRNLAELLEALVKVEGIEWIRLHYAFPTGFPMDVLEIMKREPKICNYIDIPLQHISDSILKSMKRGTTQAKTTQLLKDFRAAVPGMAIRTTLIVGYPGETQEDFEILKDFVQEMKFDRMGCFAYSHEENTTAYLLEDNVPDDVKQERANEIMELQSQISWDLNQEKVGQTFKCIIDRKEGGHFVGRTEFDSPDVDNEVLIDASKFYLKTGDFAFIKIIEATEYDLYGEPV